MMKNQNSSPGVCPYHGSVAPEIPPSVGSVAAESREQFAENRVFLLPERDGSRFIPIAPAEDTQGLAAVGLHTVRVLTPTGEYFSRIEPVKYHHSIDVLDARTLDSVVRLGLVTPTHMQVIVDYIVSNPTMRDTNLLLSKRGGDRNPLANSHLLFLDHGLFSSAIIQHIFGEYYLDSIVQGLNERGGLEYVEKGLRLLEVDLTKIKYAIVRRAISLHNERCNFTMVPPDDNAKFLSDQKFMQGMAKRFHKMTREARMLFPDAPAKFRINEIAFLSAVQEELWNAASQLGNTPDLSIPSTYLIRPFKSSTLPIEQQYPKKDTIANAWAAVDQKRLGDKGWNSVFKELRVGKKNRILYSNYSACTFAAYAWVRESDLTVKQ